MLRRKRLLLALCAALLSTPALVAGDGDTGGDDDGWCAEALVATAHAACYFDPSEGRTDTLVIFLHGVVKPGSGWQRAQQLSLVRAAKRNAFALLAPRGRRGHGPRGMEDWWTWPTSARAQEQIEAALLDEWRAARAAIERERGKPFERVWLFGFSNGAYYASQLALRGRFAANGFGVFAGGTGAEWLERHAKATRRRPPIFVGYGLEDAAARRDGSNLVALLSRLGWPHRSDARPKSGHTMPDAQLDRAVTFLLEQ